MPKQLYIVTTIGGRGVSDDTVKNYTVSALSDGEALYLGRRAFFQEYNRKPRNIWISASKPRPEPEEED